MNNRNIFFLLLVLLFINSAYSAIKFQKRNQDYNEYNEHKHKRHPLLEIEYLGSCKTFKKIRSFSLNFFQDGDCLPVSLTPNNPDEDNAQADVHCKKLGKHRSLISIKSVYGNHENYDNFVVSFRSNRPFKAKSKHGKPIYHRRPSCSVTRNYCDANENVVSTCKTTEVAFKDNYVISDDIVYVFLPGTKVNVCKKGSCCAYISSKTELGICPHTPSKKLLNFQYKDYDDKHHDDHDNKHGNDHHDNNHHDNDHHDNNHHDNDHHDNNHHDNDHHDNNHHDNDHGNQHGGNGNNHGNQQGGNGNNHGGNNHKSENKDKDNDDEDDDKRKK